MQGKESKTIRSYFASSKFLKNLQYTTAHHLITNDFIKSFKDITRLFLHNYCKIQTRIIHLQNNLLVSLLYKEINSPGL